MGIAVLRSRTGMELNEILQVALKAGASDIHLKAGLPPMFRVDGSLVPLKDARRLAPEEIGRMALGIMNDFQREKYKQTNEVDLAYGVPGLGRFRVNVFQQRGTLGVVLRVIPFKIMSIEQLMLPKVLEKVAGEQRGLVLVTGTTGSGKSTTLAAMVDHINANETCHIMTIEHPIEILIRDKRSLVNQREVGVDTMSFGQALKSALRQDPDVILVGEMRDLETIETALTAAETGHLVMSTLHTLDATETCHIMTIEDPIEFLIRDKRSIVNQREVGVDTMSFGQALKSALRQDPDVILVGEMRDLETIETALTAAETGHLVMSTLHTLDATETINRIISAFPPYPQKQVRLQLGSVRRGVISQRLVARADGRGRVPAIEVLLNTARVRELIEDKDRTKELADAISQGNVAYGMQTFDQSLMSLLRSHLITYEAALRQATNPDDFALRVSGVSGTSDSKWDSFERPVDPRTGG